jgi:hypothetical protein
LRRPQGGSAGETTDNYFFKIGTPTKEMLQGGDVDIELDSFFFWHLPCEVCE